MKRDYIFRLAALAGQVRDLQAQADRLAMDARYYEAEAKNWREQATTLTPLLDQAREQLRRLLPAVLPVSPREHQETVDLIAAIDRVLYPEAINAPEPEPPLPGCETCEACGDSGVVEDDDGLPMACPVCGADEDEE